MTRPRLSVSAAVEAFEIERRTLQRLLSAGRLDGAIKDERGRWLIPVEALHAAGFGARKTWIFDATNDATVSRQDATRRDNDATRRDNDATRAPETFEKTGHDSATRVATNDATELRQRVTQLEQQLETERRLREASERNADDLRMSLRMLEAGPTPARGRRWWQLR